MNLRTFVRPEAQTNITEAALWYEQRELGLGNRFTAETRQALKTISKMPFRFPLVRNGVRRLLLKHFPYSVYFLPENDTVVILADLHHIGSPRHGKSDNNILSHKEAQEPQASYNLCGFCASLWPIKVTAV